MKKLIRLLLVTLIIAGLKMHAFSQDCETYFPANKGSVRWTENYDKKDKLTSTVKQKIIAVEETEKGLDIIVENQTFDKKGKPMSYDEFTMKCEDGVFKMDMQQYLDPMMMKGADDAQIEINARDLELPAGIENGAKLKDGYIKVLITNMGIPMMNLQIKIYNRKFEGMEEVTTPAGTFNCYKISYNTELKTMFTVDYRSIEWFAKGVGTVKSESYDKNDKLMGHSILTKFE